MRIFRLVRDGSNKSIYKILLLKKLTANSVIEKFGNFNRRNGSLSINIFRFLFWLSKKKNIFISWYANRVFSDILVIKTFLDKVPLNIYSMKKNPLLAAASTDQKDIPADLMHQEKKTPLHGSKGLKKIITSSISHHQLKSINWRRESQKLFQKTKVWKN